VHGPEQEAIRRRYIEERYKLIPYLYTAVEEMSRTGIPVVRPLFLEFPEATADKHPLDLDAGNEFMFGSDLLVAPSPFPDKLDIYRIQFPPLDWYDYWTGERLQIRDGNAGVDSKSIFVHPAADTLPLYVREGSIVPMQPLIQSTSEIPQGPLELRVYPGRDCKGSLYLDDGKTMSYKQGEFVRLQFTCKAAGNSIKLHIGAHEGSYHPWWSELRIEVYGVDANASYRSLAGGKDLGAAIPDPAHHSISVMIPDNGSGTDLEISPR
jgi:alpha-glucosidase